MPLGNPIRKQNESRIVSVLATEGQTVFTVQGGYIVNHISVFRNGVRLSNSEDFTAGDGSTVTLNNAANVDDRIEFHVFDRFTVSGAIVSAASTQTISGDVVVNGKIFGNLDVPSINTGIGTFGGTVSIADSIVHTGDTDTSIRFPAADTITAETAGSERLRITANTLRFNSTTQQIHLATSDGSDNGYLNIGAGGGSNNQNRGAQAVFYGNEYSGNEGQLGLLAGNSGSTNGYIYFNTGNSERVRITSAGDFGLGISSPAAKLSIHETSTTSASSQLMRITTANGALFGIETDETISNPTWKIGGVVNSGTAEPLAFYQIGSEKLRIHSNGFVGIGEDSPDTNLHVKGTGTDILKIESTAAGAQGVNLIMHHASASPADNDVISLIQFNALDDSNNSTTYSSIRAVATDVSNNSESGDITFHTRNQGTFAERLRIDSSGRALIGDTTPRSHDGGNNALLQISDNVSGRWARISSTTYIDSTIGGGLILAHSRNGTVGSHTIVQDDDKIGSIFFEGSDGTDFERGASIEAFVDGTPGNNDIPGRLVFSTTPDGSVTPAERLRIDSTGRLLLGSGAISLPKGSAAGSFDLDNGNITMCIGGNSNSTGRTNSTDKINRITSPHYTNAEEPVMMLSSFNISGNNTLYYGGGSGQTNTTTQHIFYTAANTTTTTGTERMRILSDGKVLIGHTSNIFNYKLAVFGTDGGNSGIAASRFSNNSSPASLILSKSRSSSIGNYAVLSNNDEVGMIDFRGADGSDNMSKVAEIKASIDGTPGSNDMPGRLTFHTTADGASTATERMRITSGGDVLIADTSNSIYNDSSGGGMNLKANGQLVLAKEATSTADPLVWLNDTGQTTNKFIVFAQDGTEKANLGLATKTVTINSHADNSIATQITNNGTTGGHCLKLSTGGTGAGTHIFSIFSHNQSSEIERLRVDANGHLMLGTGTYTNYGGRLKVFSGAANDAVMNCINTATGGTNRQIDFYFGSSTSRVGSIQSNSSATAFNTSSDYRLKENAVAISDGITRLKTLKPYRFNFKIDASRTVDGFFAHEVTAVPEAITGTKDGTEDILYTEEDTIPSGKKVGDVKETVPDYQEIDQSKLVPLLTAALKEAVAKIETLETKVAALEGS